MTRPSELISPRWRVLLALPPIAVGIGVLLWSVGGKAPPAQLAGGEVGSVVRVVQAPHVALAPKATGYGEARPARVWSAVSQVSGRITKLHAELRNGQFLEAGTELLRIDPVDYELRLAEAEAELAELDVRESNTRASLAIEQRNLAVAERELERIRDLVSRGTTARSEADRAERTMLTSRATTQSMRNTLALIPSQRKLLEARRTQAERDLANTRLAAPFDMRVANLQVEQDEFVALGQTLFQGDSIDRVEITAQFALSALRPLFLERELPLTGAAGILNQNRPEMFALRALVRLDVGSHVAEWDADLLRFSDTVDPATRTMGVVVGVDRPWDQVIPGIRPPLSKGMYVQVVLRGKAGPKRVVLPRTAVRDGAVLVAGADDRLARKTIAVLFNQDDFAVIRSGIEPGERVVVSDLVPAVEGMLLAPRTDAVLQAHLSAAGD